MQYDPGDLAARYTDLSAEREGWLHLARRNSALTLPGLIPEGEGTRGQSAQDRPVPHNNLGAQAVNTLSAKMVLQLLPPSQPFFRLEIKPEARENIDSAIIAGSDDVSGAAAAINAELEASLVEVETRLVREVGRENIRAATVEAFKHLLVAGNVVIHVPDKGNASVIDLRNFVVNRDPSGTLLTLIVREQLAVVALPEAVREEMELDVESQKGDAMSLHKPLDLYTIMERTGSNSFKVVQMIGDKIVPGSEGTFKQDRVPYLVLRGTEAAGESYGDALVTNHEGDLIVLEGISKAIKEAAIASSMLIFGIDESARQGLERQITQANNGAAIRMKQTDVWALQVNKLADFQLAANVGREAQTRLREAFLLHQTRDAERVTAEEIRQNLAELQQALGGLFAILADGFQRPLLHRLMVRLKKRGGLAGVEAILITGVDAIGRNSELNNMLSFSAILKEGLGEQIGTQILNPSEFANRAANATSVRAKGLVRTDEEFAALQQQSTLSQAAVAGAGPIGAAAVREGGIPTGPPTTGEAN